MGGWKTRREHRIKRGYVQFKVIWYKELEILDQSLWETYQEDFKDFSVETFMAVTSVYLQRMRDHLNLRGVWVNINHKHKALTQSLYETAQEEDQAEWTREMIDVVTDKYGATLSNCIQSYNVRGTLEERRQGSL
jgi:NAD-specific glutamate dehydrogenase